MNFLSSLFTKAIRPSTINNTPKILSVIQSPSITSLSLIPSRGFKVFGKVRRRCKDCYLVTRDQRVYNLCKTHQKHKQMSIRHTDKAYYILTGVQQKKQREW
ncbi:Arthropod neurohormone/Alpha-latrotoxin associated low molecular weight protein,Ribosomal protein [Cinara cedri]|uniref:Ribosomal protein n=1 Tax=Cinara cedri TaxID=506608 RepID=A0A5E4NSD2_9HEMI|nr:Arthropod neurohormone/Alpha-latrotoxin associated low molecular weight protein,Ribosomal protein [Cinara cedri]